MKKIICAILTVFVCLLTTACIKSTDVGKLEDVISGLGEVTLDNAEDIREAEEMFNALSDSKKRKVDNAYILVEKISKLNKLQADDINLKISNIGTVILGPTCQENIAVARKAYDAANDTVKENVALLDTLCRAEEEIKRLKIKYVEDKINNIGEITHTSDSAIHSARSAYDKYPEVKSEISNYDILEGADKALLKAKVAYVEGKINDIGTVTLDSENAIQEAEKAYKYYENEVKGLVYNYEDIAKAWDALLKAKIDYVEGKICDIGSVTIDSENAIKDAEYAYNRYKSDVEGLITNYDNIAAARDALVEAKVNKVSEAIDSIGTVTSSSEYKIYEVIKVYNKYINDINSAGKTVPNEEALTKAKESFVEIVRTEGKKAFNAMRSTKSSSNSKITFYNVKDIPQYSNLRSFTEIYLVKSDEASWARGRFHYYGKKKFNPEKIIVNIDGVETTIEIDDEFLITDSDSGEFCASYDYLIYDNERAMFDSIANSKKTTVTFTGADGEYSYTVNDSDKKSIRKAMIALLYLDEDEILF